MTSILTINSVPQILLHHMPSIILLNDLSRFIFRHSSRQLIRFHHTVITLRTHQRVLNRLHLPQLLLLLLNLILLFFFCKRIIVLLKILLLLLRWLNWWWLNWRRLNLNQILKFANFQFSVVIQGCELVLRELTRSFFLQIASHIATHQLKIVTVNTTELDCVMELDHSLFD